MRNLGEGKVDDEENDERISEEDKNNLPEKVGNS